MSVEIENKTSGRVLLRFKSGLTRRLGPGERLRDVDRLEVKGNAWLRHLEDRRAIAVTMPPEDQPKPAAARQTRSRELREKEAIAYIQRTPPADLSDFMSADEDRAKVLKAFEDKRAK